MPQEFRRQYNELLRQYILNQSEQNLYAGQNLGRQLLQKNITPEDVISIHKSALESMNPDLPQEVWSSFDFLLEVMIRYGLAHQEHQSLIHQQEEMKMEIDLAANVQDTLLKTSVPKISGLDIGMISVPSKKMNGDYVYFLTDDQSSAGVAVADVMGKGIPAALCMSMIKFGIDSLNDLNAAPRKVLNTINRIVEKSVDDDMFVSMLYGRYEECSSLFTYASAGHEPAMLYKAETGEFEELHAKGILLGVLSDVTYEQVTVELAVDDFVVMMTDGVTECRTEEGFIEQDVIISLLRQYKNLSAQQMVEAVFRELEQMQNFELRDDFTLVIFKKHIDKFE